ncbi:hypothetical protein F4818DRAFT_354810 [Hypoxylon cercidicola]|nr:hypothetical protein F4818DRAFT_354810 [Hypoxylon cercidicola]
MQSFAKIINSFERSISIARTAGFILPPTGNVLSSELFLRRTLAFGTFQMAKEVERRDARINPLLRHIVPIDMRFPPGVGYINAVQRRRLLYQLKRSVWLCDQIADIVANRPGAMTRERMYDPMHTRFYEGGHEILGWRLLNPINNPLARSDQNRYINSLPLDDVAMIYYLITMLADMYLNKGVDWFNLLPAMRDRCIIFEESVLRHGSWFLWAYFVNDVEWNYLAQKISTLGLMELVNYEEGSEGFGPGLKSRLLCRFRELVGSRKHTLAKMHVVVRRIILRTNETWEADSEDDE